MRVIRDQTVIGDYPIESLKREKDDAKEVQRGMECGIKLDKFNDIKEGDTLEAYKIEEVARPFNREQRRDLFPPYLFSRVIFSIFRPAP